MNDLIVATTRIISLSTTYMIANGIAVILCLIELVRIAKMLRIMLKEDIADTEPVIFNCMAASVITLFLLSIRCGLATFGVKVSAENPLIAILNFMPVLIYIYSLRLASKLIWVKLICDAYSIPHSLFPKKPVRGVLK